MIGKAILQQMLEFSAKLFLVSLLLNWAWLLLQPVLPALIAVGIVFAIFRLLRR